MEPRQRKSLIVAVLYICSLVLVGWIWSHAQQSNQSNFGQPGLAGGVGLPTIGNGGSSYTFLDASIFTGAPDYCLQLKNAETGATSSSNTSAFVITWSIPFKAYCGTNPALGTAHGIVNVVGQFSKAIVYTSVTWNPQSGITFNGVTPSGSTSTAGLFGVEIKACNPLLHDNTWPGNATNAAPCAAYFNSTTNMNQAAIASITAASAGTATITLSGALSATAPPKFAGREICISREQATNGHCWYIKTEPSGCPSACVFTVNSTSMVLCAASCGNAFLDQPMLLLGTAGGTPNFFVQFKNLVFDCAYVYACDNVVNAGAQEGTKLENVQLFNATAIGYRKYIGNASGVALNSYNAAQSPHSGPDDRIFFNYQSETCEIFVAGCPSTYTNVQSVSCTTTGCLAPAGALIACGNNAVLAANQAIIAYSSTTTNDTCQENFVGFASDGNGAQLSGNSYSQYGIKGLTISMKDVFNTGSHVTMPSETEGICVFINGAAISIDGFHTEYCVTGLEVGGTAAQNETWLADGSTSVQGVTIVSGDMNNSSSRVIDLGTSNGSTNNINFAIYNVSTTTAGASKFVKNNFVGSNQGDCNVSTEKNIWYVFIQDAVGSKLMSDCSSASDSFVNIFSSVLQQAETTTPVTILQTTPPAVAGTYRACYSASVSAATSGVVGFTLNWTDSNGTAQSSVAVPLFQQGTATPANSFTTSAAGNYSGCFSFDINNAGAANSIKVNWVGGGTITAKASAVVERLI